MRAVLWIASLVGLTRASLPSSERPHFDRFAAEQGLAGNLTLCLDEDRWGRLYVATSLGLDRVNADGEIAPGCVPLYTQADGLARGELRDILFDRDGALWCAASQGVSLLIPETESDPSRQPVLIRSLRIQVCRFCFPIWGRHSGIPAQFDLRTGSEPITDRFRDCGVLAWRDTALSISPGTGRCRLEWPVCRTHSELQQFGAGQVSIPSAFGRRAESGRSYRIHRARAHMAAMVVSVGDVVRGAGAARLASSLSHSPIARDGAVAHPLDRPHPASRQFEVSIALLTGGTCIATLVHDVLFDQWIVFGACSFPAYVLSSGKFTLTVDGSTTEPCAGGR